MKVKKLIATLLIFSAWYNVNALAHGEMVYVKSEMCSELPKTLQFKLGDDRYGVCSGCSNWCSPDIYISIYPNKEYTFDLWNYEGRGHITESCRHKTFSVKPNTGKTILIQRNGSDIVCKYSA